MATFPAYVKVAIDTYNEAHANIMLRTEMDRGVPKQRKTQSDVLVSLPMRLIFLTKADAASFEDWFYQTALGGAAWFDWTDPRTAALRQARAVANTLGPLTPLNGGSFGISTRTLTIEYLRSL